MQESFPQGSRAGVNNLKRQVEFVLRNQMAPKKQWVRKTQTAQKASPVPRRVRNANVRASRSQVPVFGPVATIDTAPVSIGNTFGGAAPIVTSVPGGQRIKGRDFLFNVDNTAATVTSWTLVGGAPISPLCMVSSGMKSLMQMYAEYQIHGIAVHYVTSCTTGDAGAVMLYVGKNRNEPGLITNNPNFLSVVLSDPCTVISPVWKNCSAVYRPSPTWHPTDSVGSSEALHEQGPGEIFVYIRIPSTNVPGYVLIDYDVSFRTMQVNLKSLSLPISRMKYTQVRMTLAVPVAVQVATYNPAAVGEVLMDGTTPTSAPVGAVAGDIYKLIINTDDAYRGSVGIGSAFSQIYPIGGGSSNVVTNGYQDGATFYAVYIGPTTMTLFPNFYSAYALNSPLIIAAALVGTANSWICYMSYCGSVNGLLSQANY